MRGEGRSTAGRRRPGQRRRGRKAASEPARRGVAGAQPMQGQIWDLPMTSLTKAAPTSACCCKLYRGGLWRCRVPALMMKIPSEINPTSATIGPTVGANCRGGNTQMPRGRLNLGPNGCLWFRGGIARWSRTRRTHEEHEEQARTRTRTARTQSTHDVPCFGALVRR